MPAALRKCVGSEFWRDYNHFIFGSAADASILGLRSRLGCAGESAAGRILRSLVPGASSSDSVDSHATERPAPGTSAQSNDGRHGIGAFLPLGKM